MCVALWSVPSLVAYWEGLSAAFLMRPLGLLYITWRPAAGPFSAACCSTIGLASNSSSLQRTPPWRPHPPTLSSSKTFLLGSEGPLVPTNAGAFENIVSESHWSRRFEPSVLWLSTRQEVHKGQKAGLGLKENNNNIAVFAWWCIDAALKVPWDSLVLFSKLAFFLAFAFSKLELWYLSSLCLALLELQHCTESCCQTASFQAAVVEFEEEAAAF